MNLCIIPIKITVGINPKLKTMVENKIGIHLIFVKISLFFNKISKFSCKLFSFSGKISLILVKFS